MGTSGRELVKVRVSWLRQSWKTKKMAIKISEETKEESEHTGNVIIIVPVRQIRQYCYSRTTFFLCIDSLPTAGFYSKCTLKSKCTPMSLLGNCINTTTTTSTRKWTKMQLTHWLDFWNKCTMNEGESSSNKWRNMFHMEYLKCKLWNSVHHAWKWTNLACNTIISLFNFKRWQRICTKENMMIVLIVTSHKKAQGDAGIWVMKNLFLENYRVWQSQISLEGWVLCQPVSWNKDHSGMKTEAEHGTANNPMKEGWP